MSDLYGLLCCELGENKVPYYIKDEVSGDELMVVNDNNRSEFALEDRKIERKCKTWVSKLNRCNHNDRWVVEHRAT